MAFILFIAAVVIAAFSQILLKKSANKHYDSVIKQYINPEVIIGYGMLVVSTVLTIFAYKKLDLKNGPIIESLGYIMVMFLSLLFFNEKITRKKLIGNIVIIIGIIVFYSDFLPW